MEENGEDEGIYGDEGKLGMKRYLERKWMIVGWSCDEFFFFFFFFYDFFSWVFLCGKL